MQGLLETSQDFFLWDTSPVSSRPKLHPALEIATLGSENNWTRSKPAETHQKPFENATAQRNSLYSLRPTVCRLSHESSRGAFHVLVEVGNL